MKKIIYLTLLFTIMVSSCITVKVSIDNPDSRTAESRISKKRLVIKGKQKPLFDTIKKNDLNIEPVDMPIKKVDKHDQVQEDFIRGGFLGQTIENFLKFCGVYKLQIEIVQLSEVGKNNGKAIFLWRNYLNGSMECRSYFTFLEGVCKGQSNVIMESDFCVLNYESWGIKDESCSLEKNNIEYRFNGLVQEESLYTTRKDLKCF